MENKSQLRASIKAIELVNKNKNSNLNSNYKLKQILTIVQFLNKNFYVSLNK